MNELLTAANLEHLGFQLSEEENDYNQKYEFDGLCVTLIVGLEEQPKIMYFNEGLSVQFPGAFTIDDVRDLKRFLFGE